MGSMTITIGDVVVHAELLEELAPRTCDRMRKSARLKGKLNHAKVCDNEVFFITDIFEDTLENVKVPAAGDIGYWITRQTMCFWFDETEPLGPIPVFARILPKDLERFAVEARKVWKNPGTLVQCTFD